MNNGNLKAFAKRFIPFSIILVSLSTIAGRLGMSTGLQFDNTYLWWSVHTLILFILWRWRAFLVSYNNHRVYMLVEYYLVYIIFSIIRGSFIAESYWEWKGLIHNSFGLFVPLVVYSASDKVLLQDYLRSYLKYVLPFFFIVAFFIVPGAYGAYLAPVAFLLLFFPSIKLGGKAIVLVFTIIVLTADLTARSHVIRFGFSTLLILYFYYHKIISLKLVETIRNLLFIIPIVLFTLAVTGRFNIFDMNDYISDDYVVESTNEKGELVEGNLKSDTRSFLYIDVLNTFVETRSWILGQSPAKGYETRHFTSVYEVTGKEERPGTEVGILNIFLWTGIIGVILYTLIFYYASYLAINKSNNVYLRMIGLFVAFRWLYSWAEEISDFTLNYFFIWIMIGVCLSKSFREMTNNEISIWAKGIFFRRYKITKNVI